MKFIIYTSLNKWLLTVILLFVLANIFLSCNKYLDTKPDKSLTVPTTIEDFQGLLDYSSYMNLASPSWGMASADNYYTPSSTFNDFRISKPRQKKAYIWEAGPNLDYPNDWSILYQPVYYTNLVLEGIEKVEPAEESLAAWNNVKGSALFFRSFQFLRAVFIFAKAFNESTADKDYGIVLRTTSDFNEPSQRASNRETYDKICRDLKQAAPLLPDIPKHVMRPSRPAAYALLARTYLSMRKYDSCFKYADLCLGLKSDLMDYNNDADVDTTFFIHSFKRYNKEVIFESAITRFGYGAVSPIFAVIDSALYDSYSQNDLRKRAFFLDGSILGKTGNTFQGSYESNLGDYFVGIATDEVWLMRAECNARLGNKDAALSDLNMLMERRWKTGTFVPYTASTTQEALKVILTERRKELLFRDLRWIDIKRLNQEGANITLTRILDGKTYLLTPEDYRFALPIPQDIIRLAGIPQNPMW